MHTFLFHLSSRGANGMGLEPATVRVFTLSNMNINEASRPNEIEFHLEHHSVAERLNKVSDQIGLEL